jgi:hypothetical protein
MHALVNHKGKQYVVTFNRLWGQPRISHTYDVSTQGYSARASYTTRTSTVEPYGRLGMIILRKAGAQILDTKQPV